MKYWRFEALMNRQRQPTADNNTTINNNEFRSSIQIDDSVSIDEKFEDEENRKEEYVSLVCVSNDAVYKISTLDYVLYDETYDICESLLDDKINKNENIQC
eukprot:352712_1